MLHTYAYFASGKDRTGDRYFDIPTHVIVFRGSKISPQEQETVISKSKLADDWDYYTCDSSKVYSYGKKILAGVIDIAKLRAVTVDETGRVLAIRFLHSRLLTR